MSKAESAKRDEGGRCIECGELRYPMVGMHKVLECSSCTPMEAELTTLRRELEEARAKLLLAKGMPEGTWYTLEEIRGERDEALACCNAFLDAEVIDQRDKKGKATIASHISGVVMRVADFDHTTRLALKATGREK